MVEPSRDVTFGTDPEGFFKKNGKIIGSERIIPKNGLSRAGAGAIARDGVQFELHPFADVNITRLVQRTGSLFGLACHKAQKAGAEVSLETFITVSKDELKSLSEESRVLGCMPSQNVYGDKPITVDPRTYRKRSTGGHIHVGFATAHSNKNVSRAIPVFDIFVGNTCVLLDRDPHAAERRENYGRAGEYRTPAYGLEYRTISGFWLRDPSLMEFVFGLADIATSIYIEGICYGNKELWNSLVDVVNINNITRAIDTNSYTLALRNFKKLIPFINKHFQPTLALHSQNVEQFLAFANERDLSKLFPNMSVRERWESNSQETFNEVLKRTV